MASLLDFLATFFWRFETQFKTAKWMHSSRRDKIEAVTGGKKVCLFRDEIQGQTGKGITAVYGPDDQPIRLIAIPGEETVVEIDRKNRYCIRVVFELVS